jgi:hypothetical protein
MYFLLIMRTWGATIQTFASARPARARDAAAKIINLIYLTHAASSMLVLSYRCASAASLN